MINLDGMNGRQLKELLERVSVSTADKETIDANMKAIEIKLFRTQRQDIHADIKAGQADIDDILS